MPIDYFDLDHVKGECLNHTEEIKRNIDFEMDYIKRDFQNSISRIDQKLEMLAGRYWDLLERIGQIETEMEGDI